MESFDCACPWFLTQATSGGTSFKLWRPRDSFRRASIVLPKGPRSTSKLFMIHAHSTSVTNHTREHGGNEASKDWATWDLGTSMKPQGIPAMSVKSVTLHKEDDCNGP
eukprot:5657269-Amphidinium_carterae.1